LARVILVTGRMGRLGETICTKMAKTGYRVVPTGSPPDTKVKEWPGKMNARGFDCYAVGTDGNFCAVACADVAAEVRSVDVPVNKAGVTREIAFRRITKVDCDAVTQTGLDGVVDITTPVVDGMLGRRWGWFINVASVNGANGTSGQAECSAAKAGTHGFTKALTSEVARKGMTINAISPVYVGTNVLAAIPKEIVHGSILPQMPVGRFGEPEEVAARVICLALNDTAFVTGTNRAINGGRRMQ
jgi:acetoacetyl-CoA reductase